MKNNKMVIKMMESSNRLYVDWRRGYPSEIGIGMGLGEVNEMLKNVDLSKAQKYIDREDEDMVFDTVWKMTIAEIKNCQKEPKVKPKSSEPEPVREGYPSDWNKGVAGMEIDGKWYDIDEFDLLW